MFSPGGLTWTVGMMSIFSTARLTNLGFNTGNRTLTSLKISSNLLIHHADKTFDHNLMVIYRRVKAASHRGNFLYSGLFVLVHVRIRQCDF